MLRVLSTAAALLSAVVFGLGACSSPPSEDGGGTAGAGGTGANFGDAAAGEAALAGCIAFAKSFCEAAAPCCQSEHGTFDQAGCEQHLREASCEPGAAAVTAGYAVYDPEAAAPCLEAQRAVLSQCRGITDGTGVDLRRAVWESCKTIEGTGAPGHVCASSLQCGSPDGPHFAFCAQPGLCRVLSFLGEGEECPFPSGDVSLCDEGLYCTAADRGLFGVCERATPLGSPCTPEKQNLECGLGRHCDLVEAICKPSAKEEGEPCEQGLECRSFVCDRMTLLCTAPLVAVRLEQCIGTDAAEG